MKKKFIYFFLFFCSALYGQEKDCSFTLKGSIEVDGVKLPFANVYLPELEKRTTSDEQGHFEFTELCSSTVRIYCSHIGYMAIDTTFNISADPVTITLKKRSESLDRILVKGERAEEKNTQTEIKIKEEELESTRGKSLGDAIKNVSGVSSINTGNNVSKPIIHGLHGTRILIINNGVRQEGQNWNMDFAPEIDPFVASSISIIQGASSVRYGADAIGGVIKIDAPPLKEKPGIEGELNLVGFHNNRQGVVSGMVGGKFQKLPRFNWRVQGTYTKAGNAQSPNYYLENTGREERNFSYAAGYEGENWGTEVYYSQYNGRIAIYRGSHIHSLRDLLDVFVNNNVVDTAGFSYDIQRPRQDAEHELFKVKTYLVTDKNGKLSLNYSRQFNKRVEYDIWHAFQILDESAAPQLSYKLTTHLSELNWEHKLGAKWNGHLGVNGMFQKNTITNPLYLPKYDTYSGGIYWIENWKHKKLLIEGGLRYDQEWTYVKDRYTNDTITSYLHFQSFVANVGAIYSFPKGLRFKINAGSAWRPPSVNELFSNGINFSNAAFLKGNWNLSSEKVYSGIATLMYQKKWLDAQVSFFNKWFPNYVFLAPEYAPTLTIRGIFPTYSYQQAEASIRGLNAKIDGKPSSWLTLSVQADLIRGFNQDMDEYLLLMPPDRFIYSLKLHPKFNAAFLKISLEQHLEQTRIPEQSEPVPPPPAYSLLHAELGWTVPVRKQKIIVGIGVNNLLDTVYRSYMNRMRYYADDVGRNISLRIRVPLNYDFKTNESTTSS